MSHDTVSISDMTRIGRGVKCIVIITVKNHAISRYPVRKKLIHLIINLQT